ncbi:MAG: hypothetical protein KatS3mg010_1143 [Acidimicrobiia bacterium]|nr:MAG: hypothetical protein KatS3mg010_1143 [Acidimicrobiia bacterium]
MSEHADELREAAVPCPIVWSVAGSLTGSGCREVPSICRLGCRNAVSTPPLHRRRHRFVEVGVVAPSRDVRPQP